MNGVTEGSGWGPLASAHGGSLLDEYSPPANRKESAWFRQTGMTSKGVESQGMGHNPEG